MILRSKIELTYEPINNLKGIIALDVVKWSRDKENNRYLITVNDYLVNPAANPQVGEPLFTYEIIRVREIIRSQKQIDDLFSYIATDINHLNPFSNQLDTLIAQGLNIDTQQKPIYISTSADWELVDRASEVAV